MFITLEGTDGSGKTVQLRMLKERLEREGYEVFLTREPGGTPVGEAIRSVILSSENGPMEPLTEALLFAAARAQHVRQAIRPALAAGKVVLCDRFYDSSVAYQAFGRGLGVEVIEAVNKDALDGIAPDRTYLLAVDGGTARARRRHRADDRIEGAGERFFERVLEGYRHVAKEDRVCVVDAAMRPEEVAGAIWDDLRPRIKR